MAPASAIDDEALRKQFALGERKFEMLLWELAREGITERGPSGFVRAATPPSAAPAAAAVIEHILARLRERRSHQRESLETMLDFAESSRCRTAALVEHFGARLDSARCGRCDACDRVRVRGAA